MPLGGILATFKKLADEAGLNYNVHSEVLNVQALRFHYGNALGVIKQPHLLVLQEDSTELLPRRRSGEWAELYNYGTRFEQGVHWANPTPARTCVPVRNARTCLGVAPLGAVAQQRLAYEQVQDAPQAEAMPPRSKPKPKHAKANPVR